MSVLSTLPLSGCVWPVPHRSERSPEVRGRAIDSVTKEPIQGATIALHDNPQTATRTDSAGIYRLRGTHNIHLVTLMGICSTDFPQGKYYGDSLDVSHPRYQTAQIRAREYRVPETSNSAPLMLRDIDLSPVSKE